VRTGRVMSVASKSSVDAALRCSCAAVALQLRLGAANGDRVTVAPWPHLARASAIGLCGAEHKWMKRTLIQARSVQACRKKKALADSLGRPGYSRDFIFSIHGAAGGALLGALHLQFPAGRYGGFETGIRDCQGPGNTEICPQGIMKKIESAHDRLGTFFCDVDVGRSIDAGLRLLLTLECLPPCAATAGATSIRYGSGAFRPCVTRPGRRCDRGALTQCR
jgi:hypothetical protein